MFEKVLVANRGEIAIRVMRALREMKIGSVAVYSEIDRDAPHVREADEAFLLGAAAPAESYLNIEKILQVAQDAGAEAVHPGYGFLAENAPFAKAAEKAKVTFIGPPPKAIEAMGSKTEARQIMEKAGVPIVPGDTKPVEDVAAATKKAKEIGYPIAVKAAGGGGGKGFRVAMKEGELEEAFEGASREGEKFFSDPTVYLERYLEDPRHVEVQVLADSKGNVIHLGERDCSIQRRHQKLIEEAPGPHVDDEMRERIGKIADRRGRCRRLPLGRHRRGDAGGRGLLLPGDEHPRPGRALRDRDGHRVRHRARADPDRRGRDALDQPRRRSSCAGTRSSAASTPRRPTRTSRPPPARSPAIESPPGPGCASTRASRRARR